MSSCVTDQPRYQIGNRIRTVGTYTQADELTPVDPSNVYCTVTAPDGTATAEAWPGNIERDSVGVYHLDFDLDQVGYWYIRWWSEGTVIASSTEKVRCDGAY